MSPQALVKKKHPGSKLIPGKNRLYLNLDFSGEMGRKDETCRQIKTHP